LTYSVKHQVKNLLSGKAPYKDADDYRKLIILNICLYVTCFILLTFSSLHIFVFYSSNPYISLIEVISGLITLYAIIDLKRNQNIQRIALLTTSTLFLFLLLFIYLNQNNSFGLIWMIFLPIFAMTVNGAKVGLRFSLAFILILLVLAYTGIGHWQSGSWDLMSFMRLSVASVLLCFVIYINENARSSAKEQETIALNELRRLSTIDELTQISNRRNINKNLNESILNSKRHNQKLSVCLFDIDDFKLVNDHFGHLVGDLVLQKLAQQVKSSIRTTDLLGRWGGEEFLIILNHEDLNSAYKLSEKLRKTVENIRFDAFSKQITCSFGLSEYVDGMTAEQLIESADKALYLAKTTGKNRVVSFSNQKNQTIPISNYIG